VSPDRAGGLCPACLARMVDHPTRDPVEEHPLTPDQDFHGLRILGLVGRGGMGIVYKARHVALDRTVALKILPRRLAGDAGFRQRFEREAKTLAGLTHPNIVGVHDLGIEGDLTFLVMEFVEGLNLRQLLRERRLPTDQALRTALQICDGLEYAHLRGVVHRDVKPDNILIDGHGTVKITDFGLAKMIGSDLRSLTESDLVIGTPHYMAPEQLEQPKNVDHRADLYSVGVLLYEMLTGELPIGNFDPPSRRASLNPRLDEIVLRALAKEPSRRFQKAGDLKAAILQVVPALGETPATPPPGPSAHRRHGRNLELQCTCGWTFFAPATSRGFVNCPSCQAPVPAANNRPPTTRAVAPDRARKGLSGLTLAILGASGVLVLLAAILVAVLVRRNETPPEKPPAARVKPEAPAPPRGPATGRDATPAAPKAPPPVAKAFVDYDHQIEQVISRCNLAGIVATVLLHTNRAPDHDELQDRIRSYDNELRMLVAKRTEQTPAAPAAPPHFEGGDRLVEFAGKILDPLHPDPFVEGLKAWLGRFHAGISEEAMVSRASISTPLEMRFPERTKELQVLAHKIGIILGESNHSEPPPSAPVANLPPARPPPPPAVEPIPASLLAELRGRLASVNPYYRTLLGAEDSARLATLLDAGRGTFEDLDFLRFKALPLLNQGAAEMAEFAGRVSELEAKMVEGGAAVDVIHFKDGRKIEGTLEEETDEWVKLKSRFGSAKFPRTDIARLEKGKGSGVEFRSRYSAARGKKDELVALVTWCKERNLAPAKELCCWAALLLDPGQERCRAELGLERTPVAADPGVLLKEGKIEWSGRLLTAEELRRELVSLGFVLVNGQWCQKVARTFKIDNLYRDEGKYLLLGTSAGIQNRVENREDTYYSVATRSWGTRLKQVSLGRYIGGTSAPGVAHLQIDSPGEVIECRVKARSQVVKTGDSVTVSVVADPADLSPKILYNLAVPGEISPWVDVSEKVRGLTKIYVRAQTMGGGMFLPCDSNTLGVLEVRFTYGKPLDRLNATLGTRRDAVAPPPGPVARVPAAPEAGRANTDAYAEQTVHTAAESASVRTSLVEVMAEMRRQTEGLIFSREVLSPPRFAQVAGRIRDPLVPRIEDSPNGEQTPYTAWFATLGESDRKEFAIFYGLWCARARYLQRSLGR
jgi:hypothetical protein